MCGMRAGSAGMGWTECLKTAQNVPLGHTNGVWVLGWRPFCCLHAAPFCGNIPVRIEASGAVEAPEAHHVCSRRAY